MSATKKIKSECVREGFKELGTEVTFKEMNRWLKSAHKIQTTEPPFYSIRKELREAVEVEKQSGDTKLLECVKIARDLVNLVGKDDAKRLIELF